MNQPGDDTNTLLITRPDKPNDFPNNIAIGINNIDSTIATYNCNLILPIPLIIFVFIIPNEKKITYNPDANDKVNGISTFSPTQNR